ncbi:hypothetical protein SCP_0701230 [Sparassis crispa]|uniref:RGS domain-containing protein n=1 Tax=Sparassis crispa TaxID=139825 RepID=A0A401GRR9_9APHY|nr:hypothetical protein SCP_0701230 [Sparassis crispa]GBE84941.1 hypothetical protein SCP_0701230 [Sparassis crispa]
MSSSRQKAPPVQRWPRTVDPPFRAVLSLPRRLLHPPSPRGKLPSWGIAPRFTVTLDDILDRRHLPPLGLKDFEEWLLFVEHSPESLYFILWLREYTARFDAWIHASKGAFTPTDPVHPSSYRTPPTRPPPSPALLSFYMRAKHTFLLHDAPYELLVPTDALAPFRSSQAYPYDCSLPPDPLVFAELAALVRTALAESLARFVRATFANVDAPRAVCGCYGGTVILLAGSVPPIVTSIVLGSSRWWRLFALPGMWLGLTVLIAAMYGVCMMIYLFGDLRQLRSFELLRPPSDPALTVDRSKKAGWLTPRVTPAISPPTLLTSTAVESPGLLPVPCAPPAPADAKAPQKPQLSIVCGPPAHWPGPDRALTPFSYDSRSMYSQSTGGLSEHYGSDYEDEDEDDACSDARIHVSDAFFDEHPAAPDAPFPAPPLTASFIRPYVYRAEDAYAEGDVERGEAGTAAARQPVDAFDFDALPPARRRPSVPHAAATLQAPAPVHAAPDEKSHRGARALLGVLQARCAPRNIVRTRFAGDVGVGIGLGAVRARGRVAIPAFALLPSPSASSASFSAAASAKAPSAREKERAKGQERGWIPAAPFAVPVTPVLSPVVSRAQWEIVVRSGALAAVVSGLLGVVVLALPVRRTV